MNVSFQNDTSAIQCNNALKVKHVINVFIYTLHLLWRTEACFVFLHTNIFQIVFFKTNLTTWYWFFFRIWFWNETFQLLRCFALTWLAWPSFSLSAFYLQHQYFFVRCSCCEPTGPGKSRSMEADLSFFFFLIFMFIFQPSQSVWVLQCAWKKTT